MDSNRMDFTGASFFRGLLCCCLLTGVAGDFFRPSMPEASTKELSASREYGSAWRAPASSVQLVGEALGPDSLGTATLRRTCAQARELAQLRVSARSPAAPVAREPQVSLPRRLAEAVLPVRSAHAEPAAAEAAELPNPSRKPSLPPTGKAETVFGDAFSQGSLGEMTKMRAELEQLKLQVTIEEMRARLQELRSRGMYAPAGMAMPSLDYPPIGAPPTAAAGQPGGGGGMRVVSIQGLNGRYSATLSTPQGSRTVRVNDAVGGGRVVSITRNAVVINQGSGNRTLSVQE